MSFVRAAVRRYPGLAAVEAWNEPNLVPFYRPGPEPSYYVDILAATHYAVKAVRSKLPVLFGGLASTTDDQPGRSMHYLRFLRRANAAGATKYYDAVSIHAYRKLKGIRSVLAGVKGELMNAGVPKRPLWLTEFGCSSRGDEATQARELGRDYRRLRRVPGVRALLVHRMFDQPWDSMGLIRPNGSAKPAYCALARLRVGHC